MSLLYASTFTQSLTKLTAQEQKQVKVTTVDLMLDPRGNGLQLHRVERSDGFWTARVSQDLRLVLHKDGERTLLAYVGHHDDAYRWAERRRLVPHERTGAMQFVEVIERQQEELAPAAQTPSVQAVTPRRKPFAMLDDEQMLDVGVPRDWLQRVRDTDEARVDGLFQSLPAEAAEALLDYATGGRLEDHVAAHLQPGSDPFAHPDAQRRFREVEGVDELKAALDAPFAQWAVFLHPAQRAPVERQWSGPARISGSAGTGKTIVALHRSVHLAGAPDARVLLTTFSPSLAKSLLSKVELMTEPHPDARQRLTVRSLDEAAADLCAALFGPPRIASADQVRGAIERAQAEGVGDTFSADFLLEEWDEVVDAWGLVQLDEYASVPRLGRKLRLGAQQRSSAWQVFEAVRSALGKEGLTTWAEIYGRLSSHYAERPFPFSHVVVDEAQDLSVAQARFLAAASTNGPQALFFTGDLGQRIFHLPFSWLKLGLDVRGRSQALKVCYRTSHQIRHIADRLLAPVIADQDGNEESRRGTVSVFDGPDPELHLVANETEEAALVGDWLKRLAEAGVDTNDMAVLVRSPAVAERAKFAVAAAGKDIAVLPMHEAKGLEFCAVAVMALDEGVLPDAGRLATVSDFADLEAVQDTERHLLYVASTRARDYLLMTGVVPGSEFLEDLKLGTG